MPTHSTLPPVEAAAKALDALLCAIEGSPPSGAVVAYRAAITRHGRNLMDEAGPSSLSEALARVRTAAPERADDRETVIAQAWADLPGWRA